MRNKIGEYAFWIGFLFEIIYLVFRRLGYDLPFETYWLRAVTFCYCVKIVSTQHTRVEWGVIVSLGVIGFIGYYLSGMDVFFRTAMFVTSSKGIERRKAVLALWITLLISDGLYILRGALGTGGPWVDIRDYGRGAIETRYCFGFSHPNGLHYSMFALMTLAIWLFRDKLTWKHYTAFFIGNTILFYLTRSRTGAIVAYFVIFACWAFQYCATIRESRWAYWLGYVALAFVGILTMVAVRFDRFEQSSIWAKVNNLMTGRLRLAYETVWDKLPTLFSYKGADYTYADMGLVNQVYTLGIVYSLFFAGAILWLLHLAGKRRDYIEYVFVVALVLYMGIEAIQTSSIYPSQSFVWLLMLNQWYLPIKKSGKKEYYLEKLFGR